MPESAYNFAWFSQQAANWGCATNIYRGEAGTDQLVTHVGNAMEDAPKWPDTMLVGKQVIWVRSVTPGRHI